MSEYLWLLYDPSVDKFVFYDEAEETKYRWKYAEFARYENSMEAEAMIKLLEDYSTQETFGTLYVVEWIDDVNWSNMCTLTEFAKMFNEDYVQRANN